MAYSYYVLGGKGSPTDLINEWMTKVFVEQPWLNQVFSKLDGVGPVDNRPSTD